MSLESSSNLRPYPPYYGDMEQKRFKAYANYKPTARTFVLSGSCRVITLRGEELQEIVTDDPAFIWLLTKDKHYRDAESITETEETEEEETD